MAKVLIVYHTISGNTEEMAKAIEEGAASVAGTEVTLKKASEATSADLLESDAVAFGAGVYWRYMGGMLKDFFDRNMMELIGKVAGKPYVAFGSTGRGGREAVDAIEHICDRSGMQKACDGFVATLKPSDEAVGQCRELGKKLATSQQPGA